MLNAADLAKMTANEVANLSDIDAHLARNEGLRRHEAARKKIAKLQQKIIAAQAEIAAAEAIYSAAVAELAL